MGCGYSTIKKIFTPRPTELPTWPSIGFNIAIPYRDRASLLCRSWRCCIPELTFRMSSKRRPIWNWLRVCGWMCLCLAILPWKTPSLGTITSVCPMVPPSWLTRLPCQTRVPYGHRASDLTGTFQATSWRRFAAVPGSSLAVRLLFGYPTK